MAPPRSVSPNAICVWLITSFFGTLGCGVRLQGDEPQPSPSGACAGIAAAAPHAPKVLLWGDSISQGYGDAYDKLCGEGVEALLRPDFDTYVLPYNAQTSSNGLANVDQWLAVTDRGIGPMDWALIHFNHGLHDTDDFGTMDSPGAAPKVSPDEYRSNLTALVGDFRTKTSAKLLWATTTPRPTNDPRAALVPQYNLIASEVMASAAPSVPIDDLYQFVLDSGLRNSNDVHFTLEQTKQIARHVADAIRAQLLAAAPSGGGAGAVTSGGGSP